MTPYVVLEMIRAQIERRTRVLMVLAPEPIKASSPTGKLYLGAMNLGVNIAGQRASSQAPKPMSIRARLVLSAQVEGCGTGLKLAMDSAWAVTTYLDEVERLEQVDGQSIPNTRFTAKKIIDGELDSVFDRDESRGAATFEEVWVINVSVPYV